MSEESLNLEGSRVGGFHFASYVCWANPGGKEDSGWGGRRGWSYSGELGRNSASMHAGVLWSQSTAGTAFPDVETSQAGIESCDSEGLLSS